MSLFSHNTNTNILITIEYIVTLLAAGYSRENIMTNLSKKRFGHISGVAKSLISNMNSGKSYHDALDFEYNKQKQSNMKRFLQILNAEDSVNIIPMLNDMSNQIMKEKQLTVDNLIDSLSSKTQKIMIVCFLPISIFLIIFLQQAFPNFSPVVRPDLDYLINGITIIIIVALLLLMRYNDH